MCLEGEGGETEGSVGGGGRWGFAWDMRRGACVDGSLPALPWAEGKQCEACMHDNVYNGLLSFPSRLSFSTYPSHCASPQAPVETDSRMQRVQQCEHLSLLRVLPLK